MKHGMEKPSTVNSPSITPRDAKNCRLVIHHHHLAYADQQGGLWLSANIGRWVDALADNFGEVGLLLYQNEQRLPQQDTLIARENVKLHSLGTRKTIQQRILRRNSVSQVCAKASQQADFLLVRGITPHQRAIWQATPIQRKAFLLVGSLQSSNRIHFTIPELFAWCLEKYRIHELKQITQNGALMMANSPALVDEVKQVYGVQATFVPTNSIRKNEFIPIEIKPVFAPWKLLYCGRLDLKKGLRELFLALHLLQKRGYTCQLDILAGHQEPAYSQLLALSGELGLNESIRWHGLVPYGPELFGYYRQAHAFVLPTYSEGFPKVFWEAAGNCCPVITTSTGGIPSMLTHNQQAILIAPKDAEAIVGAVISLFSNESLRQQLIEKAYHYAMDFTVEACAQKLAHVLMAGWN